MDHNKNFTNHQDDDDLDTSTDENNEDNSALIASENRAGINKEVTRKWDRYKYLGVLITVISVSFLIIYLNNITEVMSYRESQSLPSWYARHLNNSAGNYFTIRTEGCTIPGMEPFSDDTKGFVEYPKNGPVCPRANHSLMERNQTYIWMNKANLKYYNITNQKETLCCYKPFYRSKSVDNVYSTQIDDRATYEKCTNFTDKIEVKDEYVKITCNFKGKEVYKQYFIFAPFKKITLYDGAKEIPKNKSSYNVIIIGIDAVSKLNFYRTMPKTLAYLRKSGAVELSGYAKVGENSYPNIVPLLLGYTASELQDICLQFTRSTYDFCPFIWHKFKAAGYYTAFAEDSSYLGTFNYLTDGFYRTPTDYYAHTFVHQAERNAGANPHTHSQICIQDKYFYQILLDYFIDITKALKNHRLFSFFWEVTITHDDSLNYPMLIDDSYERFFKELEASKYLDESIIIMLSDHGIRYGSYRYTKQGHLEERLPLLYILTPPSFRIKYSEAFKNLKFNSGRLTTPFNVHATLMDLTNMNNVENERIISRTRENYAKKGSVSLFLPIPGNRTCEVAGIGNHWCPCHRARTVAKNSNEAIAAAGYLIKHLNMLLEKYSQCARLSLAEIREVSEMIAGALEKKDSWREYMVSVRASPGDGVFEATLRFDKRNWSVSDTVSRLNLYGDQSHCVHYAQLKPYCYCK